MVYTCSPIYSSGSVGRKIGSSRPTWEKLVRLCLENKMQTTRLRACLVCARAGFKGQRNLVEESDTDETSNSPEAITMINRHAPITKHQVDQVNDDRI
jgi:hypothetical protein